MNHVLFSELGERQLSVTSPRALVVFFLAFVLVLPWIAERPFYSRGEPREALVAQAMIANGNYVLPFRYGTNFATKPPMAHWLMTLSALPAGKLSEGAARFPTAIASIVMVFAFYLFLSTRVTLDTAFLSSILLLGSIEWHRSSLSCRVDMLLSVFMGLAILALFRWEENELKGIPFAAIILCGCAVLTKGPVGVVLPGGIFGCYLLALRYPIWKAIWAGLVLSLPAVLLAAPWYFLAYQQRGDQFLQVVFSENITRITGGMNAIGDDPHEHSVWYLYGTLMAGLLPWTLILFTFVRKLFSHRPRHVIHFCRDLLKTRDRVVLLSWIAAVVIICFYSIPVSKRSTYLLPAYPFIALLLANYLGEWFRQGSRALTFFASGLAVIVIAIWTAIFLGASGILRSDIFGAAPKRVQDVEHVFRLFRNVVHDFGLFTITLLVGTLSIAVALLFFRRREWISERLLPLMASLYFGTLVLSDSLVIPASAAMLSGKEFSAEVAAMLPHDTTLYFAGDGFYGLDFYLGGRLHSFPADQNAGNEAFVLVPEAILEKFQKETSAHYKSSILKISSWGIEKRNDEVYLLELARLSQS